MKKRVVVLFGGNSSEHIISCKSAKSILENIDVNKYEVIPVVISKDDKWYLYLDDYSLVETWKLQKIERIDNIILFLKNIDIVFPIIHGNTGEDGKLQGLFDLFNIKYIGSDTLAHSLCFDKEYTKIITSKYGVPTVDYKIINKNDNYHNIKLDFGYPVIVKPVKGGSSFGISVVDDVDDLEIAIDNAFCFDDKVIIEKFIKARELECAILKTKDNLHISTIGEITYNSLFYDYDAKYISDSKLIIPSLLDKSIIDKIREYVEIIVKCLNINGLSRIDFLYDDNNLYLMEINTLPGFTTISMYPKLLEYDGIKYSDIISRLIDDLLKC